MTDLYESIRYANLVLAGALTLLMLTRLGAFARAPWPSKVGRLAVFGWVTVNGYGTWEALTTAVSPGFRVPAVTSVLLLSGYWIFTEWQEDRWHRLLSAALRDSPRATAPCR